MLPGCALEIHPNLRYLSLSLGEYPPGRFLPSIMKRKASARWQGGLKDGKGAIFTEI
jgi:hypothetical protein